MKKNILYSFLAIASIAAVTGCLPDKAEDALIYKGPTVVEVKNQDLGQIDTILNRKGVYICTSQSDSTRSVNQDPIAFKQRAVAATGSTPAVPAVTINTLSCVAAEDGSPPTATPTYRLKANAALAANRRTTDTVLIQLVGPQRSTPTVINFGVRATSTAVEGVNYDFRVPRARSITIPANSSFGYILVDIKPALTTAGSTATVNIDVFGGSDVSVNPNYSKFLLTIRKN